MSSSFTCRRRTSSPSSLVIKDICAKTDGNGGGKSTFAQGGGTNIRVLDKVLKDLESDLENE